MPLGKLIKVVREVIVYKKTKRSTYGKEIEEINVDSVPLDVLKKIVTPNADDPLLYDGYVLSPNELDKLNAQMEIKIKSNHDKFDYVLICSGIYENNNSDQKFSN